MKVTVTDRTGTKRTFDAPGGARVLHAGLLAGVGLPHECATGTCGSCRARLVEGEVRRLWPEAPGARTFRREDDVLLCQIAAETAIECTLRTAFTPPLDPQAAVVSGVLHRRQRLTEDVALFSCVLDHPLPYKAGQFVLLQFPGLSGPRAYSMTAHTPDDARLDFLICAAPGGGASDILFQEDVAGQFVQVTGPFGRATFEPEENRPFIAIAGGSGIAGMLAIIDQAERAGCFRRGKSCHLFFGLKAPGGAYLLDRLNDTVGRAGGGLDVTVAFSESSPPAELSDRYPSLQFSSGLIHAISNQALDSKGDLTALRPIYYVAGPPPMVDAAMRMLVMERRVPTTEIRYDKFA